jgi:protein-L-isoaspartate(D-aspartate) O-methyltransferase
MASAVGRFAPIGALAGLALAAGGAMAADERTEDSAWQAKAAAMVREQIEARGIRDPRVLDALRAVPRHRFVPEAYRARAFEDGPLPIGSGQTISQPYVVASMTEQLALEPGDRVLEIGTGSGYQAAVLARLVAQVYTIEIVPELAARAKETLAALGIANVAVFTGDGYLGLPEHAPFDAILLTAAPREVPQPLVDQLALGARLVAPIGGFDQELRVLERTKEGIATRILYPVRFVPFVRGGAGDAPRPTPEDPADP